MAVMMLFVLIFGGSNPPFRSGVLAYATDMTSNGLLQASNVERQKNGASNLRLNQDLIQAAQAKANDMVQRNYWSHNTPDGQPPWVFIQQAGYDYKKAGENLAYGFTTSSGAVTGWMNSPPHRENLLDKAYVDVGFGIANSSNYNSSGPETVVVAMYGQPRVLGTASPLAPSPTANPAPISTPSAIAKTPAASNTVPRTTAPSQTKPTTPKQTKKTPQHQEESTRAPNNTEPASVPITRAQRFLGSSWIIFAVTSVSALAVITLLLKHSLALKRLLEDGEQFFLHHPLLDCLLISIALLGYYLSATVGVIR